MTTSGNAGMYNDRDLMDDLEGDEVYYQEWVRDGDDGGGEAERMERGGGEERGGGRERGGGKEKGEGGGGIEEEIARMFDDAEIEEDRIRERIVVDPGTNYVLSDLLQTSPFERIAEARRAAVQSHPYLQDIRDDLGAVMRVPLQQRRARSVWTFVGQRLQQGLATTHLRHQMHGGDAGARYLGVCLLVVRPDAAAAHDGLMCWLVFHIAAGDEPVEYVLEEAVLDMSSKRIEGRDAHDVRQLWHRGVLVNFFFELGPVPPLTEIRGLLF